MTLNVRLVLARPLASGVECELALLTPLGELNLYRRHHQSWVLLMVRVYGLGLGLALWGYAFGLFLEVFPELRSPPMVEGEPLDE
jgi:hypothetical protein